MGAVCSTEEQPPPGDPRPPRSDRYLSRVNSHSRNQTEPSSPAMPMSPLQLNIEKDSLTTPITPSRYASGKLRSLDLFMGDARNSRPKDNSFPTSPSGYGEPCSDVSVVSEQQQQQQQQQQRRRTGGETSPSSPGPKGWFLRATRRIASHRTVKTQQAPEAAPPDKAITDWTHREVVAWFSSDAELKPFHDWVKKHKYDGQDILNLARTISGAENLPASITFDQYARLLEKVDALIERSRRPSDAPVLVTRWTHHSLSLDLSEHDFRPIPTNLPATPCEGYVPRETIQSDVWNLLEDEGCRLISIVGPSGVGKSVLAAAMGIFIHKSGRFESGIFWVDCRGVSNARLISQSIARIVQGFPGVGPSSVLGLAKKPFERVLVSSPLLILDGIELALRHDSVEMCNLLKCLAWPCGMRVLVTTTDPVTIEHSHSIQIGLPSTKRGQVSLEALEFLKVACKGHSQNFLKSLLHSRPESQLTMKLLAMLAVWARNGRGSTQEAITDGVMESLLFEDLPENARACLLRLAVFPEGSFSRAAAEFVGGCDTEILLVLVRSLFLDEFSGRYSIHATVRAFLRSVRARSRRPNNLFTSTAAGFARRRLIEFILAELQRGAQLYNRGKKAQGIEILEVERPIIEEIFKWSTEDPLPVGVKPEVLLEFSCIDVDYMRKRFSDRQLSDLRMHALAEYNANNSTGLGDGLPGFGSGVLLTAGISTACPPAPSGGGGKGQLKRTQSNKRTINVVKSMLPLAIEEADPAPDSVS